MSYYTLAALTFGRRQAGTFSRRTTAKAIIEQVDDGYL